MAGMEDYWESVGKICKHFGVSSDIVFRRIARLGMPAYLMRRYWKFKKNQAEAASTSADSSKEDVRKDSKK